MLPFQRIAKMPQQKDVLHANGLGRGCGGLGRCGVIGRFDLGPLHVAPRWNPAYVTFPNALRAECVFFFAFAGLLLAPLHRISDERVWRRWFTVLCLAAVVRFAARAVGWR